jgi:hypothetical protein
MLPPVHRTGEFEVSLMMPPGTSKWRTPLLAVPLMAMMTSRNVQFASQTPALVSAPEFTVYVSASPEAE